MKQKPNQKVWIDEWPLSPAGTHTPNLAVLAIKNREILQNLTPPNQRIVICAPVHTRITPPKQPKPHTKITQTKKKKPYMQQSTTYKNSVSLC